MQKADQTPYSFTQELLFGLIQGREDGPLLPRPVLWAPLRGAPMDQPYVTVTMELSGSCERELLAYHDLLCQLLKDWAVHVEYGNVTVAYQDPHQIDRDARVEAEEEDLYDS